MDTTPQQQSEEKRPEARRPLRVGKTLRWGIRAAWDHIGLVCAVSLTLFAGLMIPVIVLGSARSGVAALAARAAAAILYLLIVPPLFGGACWVAQKAITFDEPSYPEFIAGTRRIYRRAVLLGAIQFLVSGLITVNLFFYLPRGSFLFLLLGVAFGYLLLFWMINCLYHWPLLVAAEEGIIRREDGSRSGLAAVIRNGFVLAASSPGYSMITSAVLILMSIPLVISGVGMAMLLPGVAAFISTQAAQDQLVRFGAIPEPPDLDAPVVDEGWRVKGL